MTGETRPPAGEPAGEPGLSITPRAEGSDQIVLVPLDRSPEAAAALPVARTLAHVTGATLHLVLLGGKGAPPPDPERDLGIPPEALHGAVLERRTGATIPTIAHLSREWPTFAVVLTTAATAPESNGGLAPETEEALWNVAAPVVLVPRDRGLKPWDLRLILVPHDGTPTTAAAVGFATNLARRAEAELTILHVVEPGGGRPTEPGTFTIPRYIDQPQHEWPAWAHEFLNRCCAAGMPYTIPRIRILLASGEPGAEIVRLGRELDADLVVLGWHGRLQWPRAARMKTVIRAAPCPMLILRVGG